MAQQGESLVDTFLKVYQLAGLIKQQKFAQIQQQHQQDLWQQEAQDKQRQRQMQDFVLQNQLGDLGATEATPGVKDAMAGLTQELGPPIARNPLMNTPIGQYYVPRHELQQQQALADLRAKKQAEIEGTMAAKVKEEQLLGPMRTAEAVSKEKQLAAIRDKGTRSHFETDSEGNTTMISEDLRTGEIKKVSLDKIGKAQSKNLHIVNSTDDQGNQTITAVDPETGKPVGSTVLPGVGKSKAAGAGGTGGISKAAEDAMHKAQASIDAAKSNDPKYATTPVEERFKKAQQQVQMAVEAHPNELQGDYGEMPAKGDWRWPNIKPKTAAAPVASSSTEGQSLNASQQKMRTALSNYRKLTPQQKLQNKGGVTPRSWFIKTFGVDPETLQ